MVIILTFIPLVNAVVVEPVNNYRLSNLNISADSSIKGICKTPNASFLYLTFGSAQFDTNRYLPNGTDDGTIISHGDVGAKGVACNDEFIYVNLADPDIVHTFNHAGVDQSENYDYRPEPWGNVNPDLSVAQNNSFLYMYTGTALLPGAGNFSIWNTSTQLERANIQFDLQNKGNFGMCTTNKSIFTSTLTNFSQWDINTGEFVGGFDFSALATPVDETSLGCNESAVDVNLFLSLGSTFKMVTFIADKVVVDNPPLIVSTFLNETTPDFFEVIRFDVVATDDIGIINITLADNRTGTLLNFTSVTVSGTLVNHSFNISAVSPSIIQLQATVIDTLGQSNQSILIIPAVPRVQLRGNETGNLANWTGGVTSEEGNYVIDAVGEFGRYINELPGASVERNHNNWSIFLDIAVDLTTGVDKRIAEFWLDNTTHTSDTNLSFTISILSNNSVELENIPDGTTDIIEGITDDGLFRNVQILFSDKQVEIINASGVVRGLLALNENFTNITFMNFGSEVANSPNVRWDNFSIVNGTSRPEQFANVYRSSGDTTPPNITLIFPANNTRNNTVPLPIIFLVTGNNNNSITCDLRNTTTLFDSNTFQQSVNVNLTLGIGEIALSQNFPNLNLTCFDNSALNNSATMLLNYTLDNVNPIIFSISPFDGSVFNKDVVASINIKSNCTDTPVFRLNITIRNSSDTIASFESRSSVNNFIVIDENLNIADLGVGIYSVNNTCADPHTKKIISNYNIKTNDSEYGIRFTIDPKTQFRIRYLNDSLGIVDYGSSKDSGNSKYNFWYDTGEVETKTIRTYTFEILSRKLVYHIQDSSYNGHFVTGDNWIDFELNDPDAIYIVSQNENSNYEISITTKKTKLNFNSVGDLNVISQVTQFEITSIQQIKDDTFNFVDCPLQNLQTTVLFIFFIMLSFGIMIIGFNWRIGIVGFLGAILLLILSTFVYSCMIAVGITLSGLAIILISFFVIKGTRNFN